jgi:hypothetical protein
MQATIDPKIEAAILHQVNNNLPNDPGHPGNIFHRAQLRVTDTPEQPPVVLSLMQDQHEHVICTLGNITTIIGKAKSRKTYFTSLLAGLFLRAPELLPAAPQFRATLPAEKRNILYVDTEQGKHHCLKVLRRMVKIAGLPEDHQPDNLYYLSLRPFTPDQRLQVIEYALGHLHNVGVLFIDGARDLIFDINSAHESTTAVNNLMRWSDLLQLHVVTVLHQNKGDLNARGHLGSELVNKSESVISIEKENEISLIKSVQLRDRDFEDIAFGISEQDCPYITDCYQASEPLSKYNDPADQPDQFHRNLLDFIFSEDEKFSSFNDFWKKLKSQAANSDIKIGDNKARDWASYYLKRGFVENTGTDKRWIIERVN